METSSVQPVPEKGCGDSLHYVYYIVNTPAGGHDAVMSFLGLLMVDFDNRQ